MVIHLKTHTGEKSDKCNQWNYTTFLHRVSGWQFGKTKSYHQQNFGSAKIGLMQIYTTVHQHTCVCHHVHLQSFMDIDLLLSGPNGTKLPKWSQKVPILLWHWLTDKFWQNNIYFYGCLFDSKINDKKATCHKGTSSLFGRLPFCHFVHCQKGNHEKIYYFVVCHSTYIIDRPSGSEKSKIVCQKRIVCHCQKGIVEPFEWTNCTLPRRS